MSPEPEKIRAEEASLSSEDTGVCLLCVSMEIALRHIHERLLTAVKRVGRFPNDANREALMMLLTACIGSAAAEIRLCESRSPTDEQLKGGPQ